MLVVQLRALNTVGLTLGAGLTFIFFLFRFAETIAHTVT